MRAKENKYSMEGTRKYMGGGIGNAHETLLGEGKTPVNHRGCRQGCMTQEARSSSENGHWEEALEIFREKRKCDMVLESGR